MLYELVWMRTVASQMADARGQTVSLRLGATSSAGEDAEFGASGTVITFRGFLAAYEEGRDDEPADDEERRLPQLAKGDDVKALGLEPQGHETLPPARYTEPSLVKELETAGSAAPRPTRRSSGRSSIAATSSRRARRSSRRSSPSR